VKNPIKQRYYDTHKSEIQRRALLYRQTPRGYLNCVYQNMRKRVRGKDKGKEHLYEGLPLLDKVSFVEWSLGDTAYQILFLEWERGGFRAFQGPSIDRRNSSKGYVIDNLRWVTHSLNSQMGAISRWST
jgi:hypothetical protein